MSHHPFQREEDHSNRSWSTWFCINSKYLFVGIVIGVVIFALKEYSNEESLETTISPNQPFPPKKEPSLNEPSLRDQTILLQKLQNYQAPDQEMFLTLRKQINQVKQNIWKDWDISQYPNFLETMHIPSLSWEIQKLKFVKLLFDKQLDTKTNFVIGFSGSSVTAGHDNYFTEAYPNIVYTNLKPIFESINIPFIVRNSAIGNNPCYPYDACIATQVGDDLDILTWEQSMNCGRDSRPLDTFTRTSYSLTKKPTIMYLLSGGPAWTPDDCIKANFSRDTMTPRTDPLSLHEKKILSSPLSNIANQSSFIQSSTFLVDQQENLANRFSNVAPMVMNTFPIGDYKCYGPYNLNFTVKTPGGGAAWHPGKLSHKHRGDILSYYLLTILDEAIDSYLQFVYSPIHVKIALTPGTLFSLLSDQLKLSQHPITSDGSHYLQSFLHHEFSSYPLNDVHNMTSLRGIILYTLLDHYFYTLYHHPLPKVPEHYQVPETQYAPTCYTDYLPRLSHSLQDQLIPTLTPDHPWTHELSFFDQRAVEKGERNHMGYLDRKIVYMSNGTGSSLSLKVTIKHPSPLWLCELQKGFLKYPTTLTELHLGSNISLLLNYNPSTSSSSATSSPILNQRQAQIIPVTLQPLIDQCFRSIEIFPSGNHLLTLVQNGAQKVTLAYVISW